MSTKTTFKRVALVTVAALSFGLLSSVAPASAAVTGLVASVGPAGQTSLTVVGDTSTAGALVRLDVVTNDTTSATTSQGLSGGATITSEITGVPTAVTAKTLAANGGSMADTSTAAGSGRGDLSIIETMPATSGSTGTLAADAVSAPSDWTKMVRSNVTTNMDSTTPATAFSATSNSNATDGVLSSSNTGAINMDTNHEIASGLFTKSYYVTILPRAGALVGNQGAYTVSFSLVSSAGVILGTKTVKIDFVTTSAKADAVLTYATSGTFLNSAALTSQDTAAATYATLTLKNREGGLVRQFDGGAVVPSATIQWIRTGLPTSDTITLVANDSGTYGLDFGRNSTTSPGNGTLQGANGVYGLTAAALPTLASAVGNEYQLWSGYGNATIQTLALIVYAVSGTGTAKAGNTDVLVTAAGMSAANQELISGTAATNVVAKTWTLPTTTKTATLKFAIQTSADTATPGALITVTPTWSGIVGTAQGTPATSTTGTVYTTDSNGNFTVTVTYDAPLNGATLGLVLSGGAAFGAGTYTATLAWATPVVTKIDVRDPVAAVSVLSGSTNVTTVRVRDQFDTVMSGQSVSVSVAETPAVVSTTVITPIVTGASGTATYSFTPAAATTSATLSFTPSGSGIAAVTHVYTYVATLPVVATLTGYFGYTYGTAATLVPATGIYNASGTALTLVDARNISKALTVDGSTTNDQIALLFTGLTSAGVSATGASVTITAGTGGHILNASNLPVKTRTYAVTASGTAVINVLATGTGAITFTATSGTVTATAAMWVAPRLNTDNTNTAGRFVAVTASKTGAANGTGVPVTVAVTDRYGNPVSGVALNVVASGVGSFMGGNITQSFTTDASGSYTFLASTTLSDGGVAKFTATTGTVGSFDSLASYVGATEVDSTLAAGNASASAEITFAAGASATDVAQAATDAAAEATDAANAATDAANAAAEAADAATAAAQDAADAVAALATSVEAMIGDLKKQITALTNLIIKIQKKVKA